MSIYKGTTKISGSAKVLSFPLFTATWQDHIVNESSWLRADTFSWQSGSVYTSAYAHLVADISGITAETETISGTTITFYRATDGHKIVLADQESNVSAIFNSTGVAWYYILDTDNTRFKLPRSKWAFKGITTNAGDYVSESLPNLKGASGVVGVSNYDSATGVYEKTTVGEHTDYTPRVDNNLRLASFKFNASRYSSTYQDNAPVQQRATQAYLYFYVGNTIQNETSVNVAGLTEDLNGKADLDLANLNNAGKIVAGRMSMPSDVYTDLSPVSGVSYTAPADGWVNVRGITTVANGYVYMYINDAGADYNICYAPVINYEVGLTMPVRKGQTFNAASGGATLTRVRFFYAEGSKSEI